MATPTGGLQWSAPSGVPTTCFPLYMISQTDAPAVTVNVTSTMPSSNDLGTVFPRCQELSITVTPFLASGTPLTMYNATGRVAIHDPGKNIMSQ